MTINQRIRIYLKSKGITARSVAQRSGLDEKLLSRMLTNKRKITTEEYGAICKALEVSEDYFYKENFLETTNATA